MRERREKSSWDDLAKLLGAGGGEENAELDVKVSSIDSSPEQFAAPDTITQSVSGARDTVQEAAAQSTSEGPSIEDRTSAPSTKTAASGNRRRDGWRNPTEATPNSSWGSLPGELGLSLPPAPPSNLNAQRTVESRGASSEPNAGRETDSPPARRDPHAPAGSEKIATPSTSDATQHSIGSECNETANKSTGAEESDDTRPKRRRRRRGRGRQSESQNKVERGEDDEQVEVSIDDGRAASEEKDKNDRADETTIAPKRRRRRGRRRPRQSTGEAAASLEAPRSTEWLDESREVVGGEAERDEAHTEDDSSVSVQDSNEDAPKPAGRSRRRGGRRRSGGAGRDVSSAEAETGEAARRNPSNSVGASTDATDEADEDELDLEDDSDDTPRRPNHKNIPSWEETIAVLVDANLASRSTSSGKGSPRAGSRGRSRGRGRRKE